MISRVTTRRGGRHPDFPRGKYSRVLPVDLKRLTVCVWQQPRYTDKGLGWQSATPPPVDWGGDSHLPRRCLLSARHYLPPTNVSSVLVFAHCPFSTLARSSGQLPSTYFVAPPLPHPPFTQSFISQPPVIFAVFAIISLDEPMHSSTNVPNSHARA
jgi:hypothetical protein